MARIRTAWVARECGVELDAYLRRRAWHWAAQGNFSIAADYTIRLLNRHSRDPLALLLGEICGWHTRQEAFATKCRESQKRLCFIKGVPHVLDLIKEPKEALVALKDMANEVRAAPASPGTPRDEQIKVVETEQLTQTQRSVQASCQRASHTPLVELLEPKQSTYGRGLYAAQRISPRTALLVDQPLLVQRLDERHCTHCLSPMAASHATSAAEGRGVMCPYCQDESYCSTECQEAAWSQYHACCCASHNSAYANWSRAMRDVINSGGSLDDAGSDVRSALLCLAVAKVCAVATVQRVHPLALPGICSLRGVASYDATTALSEVGAMAVALADSLHQHHLRMEEVLSLFAILQANEVLFSSGVALYPVLSMLNHSCEPNCTVVGATPATKQLVALREIRDGEQLFIDYNSHLTTKLTYEQRKALCAQRQFECFCRKFTRGSRCTRKRRVHVLARHYCMLRCLRALKCATAHATLSIWLKKIAVEAEALRLSTSSSSGKSASALWDDIELASAQASSLKETDTLFSIVQCLLNKHLLPPREEMWPTLAQRLLMYGDVEASSVLYYPGVPDAVLRERKFGSPLHQDDNFYDGGPYSSKDFQFLSEVYSQHSVVNAAQGGLGHRSSYYVLPSRETLLLTGGIVPLSARVPCSRGHMTASFLNHFCTYAEEAYLHQPPDMPSSEPTTRVLVLKGLCDVLIDVFNANAATTQADAVLQSLIRFLHVLFVYCKRAPVKVAESAAPSIAVSFAEQLVEKLTTDMLGARAVLGYVRAFVTGCLNPHHKGDGRRDAENDDATPELDIALLLTGVKAVSRTYVTKVKPSSEGGLAVLLGDLYTELDVALQRNANRGNPFSLSASAEEQLRVSVSLALLRALRLESNAPDIFLQEAMLIADRCPPSMAMEAELLAGKVHLINYFELEEDGREAVYADLVTSLRNLVELRPRVACESERDPRPHSDGGNVALDEWSLSDSAGKTDAHSQDVVQRAHASVIRCLCASRSEAHINEAYTIVVTHKYHGLIVTKEIIHPLMEVMSRRGDCRVFNLVDVCVLYSNCTIDMETVSYLFRACAVAGDHYRARTLLQLLKEIIPGFLLKASDEVYESLQELKVVEGPPSHLFVSEEQQLVDNALGKAATPLRELPNMPKQ